MKLTQEQIIRFARKSELEEMWDLSPRFVARLERFAVLVAAAEREACAKVCDELAAQSDLAEAWISDCAAAIRARGQS